MRHKEIFAFDDIEIVCKFDYSKYLIYKKCLDIVNYCHLWQKEKKDCKYLVG